VRLFRPARPARTIWNVLKTLAGLILGWFVFLFLVPVGISIVEVDLGIQRFPPQYLAAAALLLSSTLVACWAALTVAIAGQGTPLPFDGERRIVVAGPYAYLRYPLALSSTGQLVALAVALGSVPVLVYGALAFVLWYYWVRPAGERDQMTRFGEAWRAYAGAVRGFRPRLTPYRPGPE
jgi:protein-S-isoprenylcysteine O-methyltransferase Ste14